MKRMILFSVLALAAAGPAQAMPWTVDAAKSVLGFQGSQGGSPFTGHFGKWTADIDFDPAHPESGHALVVIDMASARTGDPQKDQSLPQSDWFDVKGFPQATFQATSFRAKGGKAFEAVGSLAIRGIKKDVVLPFQFDEAGGTAHVTGRLPLIRTDYGVGQGDWKDGSLVALDVAVTLDIQAAH
jgi:polyisoprenoid-binding protein YceI